VTYYTEARAHDDIIVIVAETMMSSCTLGWRAGQSEEWDCYCRDNYSSLLTAYK